MDRKKRRGSRNSDGENNNNNNKKQKKEESNALYGRRDPYTLFKQRECNIDAGEDFIARIATIYRKRTAATSAFQFSFRSERLALINDRC